MILAEIISKAAEKNGIPKGSVQLIETREQVAKMLKMDDYISLVIPRGSSSFVKYVQQHTKIPVLGHSDGKCQYPAVCNAMETMLVHKAIAKKFLPLMIKKFKQANVGVRGDEKTRKI